MLKRHPTQRVTARAQRGVALITAIIVLVAMTLAGLALVRSTLTSTRIAGNLAFQQSATQSADVGIETAIAWLEDNNTGTRLHNNVDIGSGETVGYFARREDPAASQSWTAYWTGTIEPTARVNTLPVDGAGNRVSFVIHRLCNSVGDPSAGIGCEATPELAGSESGGRGAGVPPLLTESQRYYRITARVDGPRNTVSFVQVVVAL